jgi:hypothetical protein
MLLHVATTRNAHLWDMYSTMAWHGSCRVSAAPANNRCEQYSVPADDICGSTRSLNLAVNTSARGAAAGTRLTCSVEYHRRISSAEGDQQMAVHTERRRDA